MELVLLAFGLAMDGFAVSVCKGLNMKQGTSTMGKAAATGIWFGGSQLLLLLLGYSVGISISEADHVAGSLDCMFDPDMDWWNHDPGIRSLCL